MDSDIGGLLRESARLTERVSALENIAGRLETMVARLEERLEERIDSVRSLAVSAEERTSVVELARVTQERDRLAEQQRHWLRYIVTAVVSLACGGAIAILSKFIH